MVLELKKAAVQAKARGIVEVAQEQVEGADEAALVKIQNSQQNKSREPFLKMNMDRGQAKVLAQAKALDYTNLILEQAREVEAVVAVDL